MNNTPLEFRSAKLPLFSPSEGKDLPTEWPLVSLGGLCSFANGVNANKDAYGKGIPFANVLEIITHSHLHSSEIPGRVLLSKPAQERFTVRRGDILFNRTSETQEEVGLAAVYDDSEPIVFGGFVIRGRFNIDALDRTYVGYALRASIVRSQIISQGQGAIRANIGQLSLKRILIPIPSRVEQRDIAAALSHVDELLRALEVLIAKKRAIKQATMQQLLTGKTRLPGFHGEWIETNLGAIGECVIGLTYKPENVVDYGLLVLRASNIQNGRLTYDDNVYVNVAVPDRLITQTGDVLVCVRNGSRALIGKCAVISDGAAGLTFGAFMSVYRTKHWQFLAHAFQGQDIQCQIRDNIGATINQITNKDMKALRIKLPCEDEQIAIADVLSNMDAEITALEVRRDKTRAIKQGMMQQLLTGRIRLVKPQSAEADA